MLEKAAALKRFEYSLLSKELKAQTNAAERQYQVLNKIFKPDEKEELETIKKEKPEIIVKWKLIFDSKHSFSENRNVRNFSSISFISKYCKWPWFDYWLNEFKNLISSKE